MRRQTPYIDPDKVYSRRDLQEVIQARLAGGDLYANEYLQKIREADKKLDRIRVACGEKPLYGEPE